MSEIQEILFDEKAIEKRVKKLAAEISRDYEGKDLVLIGILKGAAVFMADLMRLIPFPITIDFIHASSYGMGTETSREIRIKKDIDTDVKGRHVLLVDTIIDTGETLHRLFELFRQKGPASLKAVVLLDKKPRRTVDVPLAYRGFEIPDKFVVGYGVDCGERYRNLPYVAAIKPT
jgi:hypoxanthine phosphoribosyltransferase